MKSKELTQADFCRLALIAEFFGYDEFAKFLRDPNLNEIKKGKEYKLGNLSWKRIKTN